jgi:hypothetical protein
MLTYKSLMNAKFAGAGSLFVRDGDGFLPTPFSGSPWSEDALHGGPPAALLSRAIENFEGGNGFFVARITFELMRPVPHKTLTLDAELIRPGRKVQLVRASLRDGDREVMRATGLRIRRLSLELPKDLPAERAAAIPPPSTVSVTPRSGAWIEGFHTRGVEHRFVRGDFDEPGPATDWIRIVVPLLPDEPLSPLARACATADFGNGVSGMLQGSHTYVNPDLTVHLHRYPEGEWVCLDAVTRVGSQGMGIAESLIYDERGPIGRSVQSLIIEPR